MKKGFGVSWRSTGPFLLFLLLAHFHSLAKASGLCTMTGSNLPTAACTLPQCTSATCSSPTVDLSNALMTYNEPTLQWADGSCPDFGVRGCWTTQFSFNLALGTSSNVGIQNVGVELRIEIQNHATYIQKIYGPALTLDGQGRYQVPTTFTENVPPEGTVIVSVLHLCSQDRLGHETCVDPQRHLSAKRLKLPQAPNPSFQGSTP